MRAFNPSRYERAFDVRLVLSGTVADMLSRASLPYKGKEVDDFESVNMVCYLPISDQRLDETRMETRKDQCLREFSETILVGWPEKEHPPALTHPYFSMCNKLTVQDGLVFKGNPVVILN